MVLESEWVLRARYTLPKERVIDGLRIVAGLPGATVVAAAALAWALERWRGGGDFADWLHIALAADADASGFVTFDRRIATSGEAMPLPIETLG